MARTTLENHANAVELVRALEFLTMTSNVYTSTLFQRGWPLNWFAYPRFSEK